MSSSNRIYNFSAGPAVIPLPVLEQAQRELVALPGVGMSVMEISHRSKTFEALLARAIADVRELAGLDDFHLHHVQPLCSIVHSHALSTRRAQQQPRP